MVVQEGKSIIESQGVCRSFQISQVRLRVNLSSHRLTSRGKPSHAFHSVHVIRVIFDFDFARQHESLQSWSYLSFIFSNILNRTTIRYPRSSV
jgi:hypothetical protein